MENQVQLYEGILVLAMFGFAIVLFFIAIIFILLIAEKRRKKRDEKIMEELLRSNQMFKKLVEVNTK